MESEVDKINDNSDTEYWIVIPFSSLPYQSTVDKCLCQFQGKLIKMPEGSFGSLTEVNGPNLEE